MPRPVRFRASGASARQARVTAALWILWAIVVWNVALDQVIVLANLAAFVIVVIGLMAFRIALRPSADA